MDTIAADIMTREVQTAPEGISVEEALKILINSRITGMPVTSPDGKMIGILSESDILLQMAASKTFKPEIFQAPARFSKTVEAVRENTSLKDIIDLFLEKKYRRLPVVDDSGKLTGIITKRDMMKIFYYRARLR